MPNGSVEEATALDALQHNLRAPARDIHIVPSIERDSLLSVSKFADANYIAIFDKDEVKIFDAKKYRNHGIARGHTPRMAMP